ncbi:hypothetical protein A2954_02125 [Candidatus Roizmanbacteria bacterium RIFCSPLOWO2_01_FULL_37_12]|uniref:Uncharacterized protein n=2 Tax=Microgenomates group TaxID=1794810 RepID=A0A1F7IB17_9BACT|nr:MAG: hypothetical protein A2777_03745 [Candidatus Gottesmanbacteria bacterium RIFCSPHIGHO2_01_FULL_40_15]OGK40548.1 MAG: hypothetical protein A2954_02125 [Candidatus Roizmanbacteria bacterium RIFCSPLOWO2_01_FULL_37_12]
MNTTKFVFYDWDKYKELEGTFTAQYRGVGKWRKNVFEIKLDVGAVVHCWANAALYRALSGVPFGTKVKIKYLGLEVMENGRAFHNYEVDYLGYQKPEKIKKKKVK